jgi:hypothetical protein
MSTPQAGIAIAGPNDRSGKLEDFKRCLLANCQKFLLFAQKRFAI